MASLITKWRWRPSIVSPVAKVAIDVAWASIPAIISPTTPSSSSAASEVAGEAVNAWSARDIVAKCLGASRGFSTWEVSHRATTRIPVVVARREVAIASTIETGAVVVFYSTGWPIELSSIALIAVASWRSVARRASRIASRIRLRISRPKADVVRVWRIHRRNEAPTFIFRGDGPDVLETRAARPRQLKLG